MNKITKSLKYFSLFLCIGVLFSTQTAQALDLMFYSGNDVLFSNPNDSLATTSGCSSASGGGGSLDGFLKALAMQESGGNPTAQNSTSSAAGKYQYITGTWQGVTVAYPPAQAYPTADKAPEAVQDAVAYIEYAQKWNAFNGDVFKLAVSHFLPSANDDESLLDVTPPGNSITPREYGNAVVEKVASGYGSDIPLSYSSAPDFQKHLDAALKGAPLAAGSTDGCTVTEGGLTEEQAKIFVQNYGTDKGGSTTKAILSGTGIPSSGCKGGLLSNCTSFSAFFVNKFTGEDYKGGDGSLVALNLGALGGVPTGKTPQLYAVFSWGTPGDDGHTGVILGIHGDTMIVGQASCGSGGVGAGDGVTLGKGAAVIKIGKIDENSQYYGTTPTLFAYPRDVNVTAIQEYLNAAT